MSSRALARLTVLAAIVAAAAAQAGPAWAQGFSAAASKPKPWSRISFYTNASTLAPDGGPSRTFSELSTAFTYQLPETDEDGADYGIDVRYAGYAPRSRPDRASIYEGFVGARLAGGAIRARVGHVWLQELASLGSLAGGVFELRAHRARLEDPRWRAGAFAGLEPNILDTGYASGVRKFGGYFAYDGTGARRHSVGYALVRHGSLTERSAVTTTNFLPMKKLFVYQSAEFDVQAPDGMASRGLAYFFANARYTATSRLELQATYNRGRAIDVRGLGDDVINGRPITQTAVDGLLYQSVGGRATVQMAERVHVYGGYSRDKNNRDADQTGRTLIGGYASNIRRTGLDLSASDSTMHRSTGSYHSRYISLGRQVGRSTYLSGDYSTSLSVIRFSRSDGITIETRPHTTRISGTATVTIGRSMSLLATVERTREDTGHDLRVLTGLTYRIR